MERNGGGMILISLLALFFGHGAVILCLFLAARKELRRFQKNIKWPTSISVHTYKPRKSIIPARGWLVLKAGCEMAKSYHCPLILSVGKTIPDEPRTEAEIYRDGARQRFGDDVNIITGIDPLVRETAGEVQHTLVTCRAIHSQQHIVIGLAPHIGRIRLMWDRYHPSGKHPEILFYPVKGPAQYWLWETAMLCIYIIAPPGSRLQGILLDLGQRKG